MVFRRDNKGGDAFQRQISALRQQLGGSGDDAEFEDEQSPVDQTSYGSSDYPAGGYEPEEQSYGGGYRDQYTYDDAPAAENFEQVPGAIPVADATMTVVSSDTTWKGEVDSEGSMHIHGTYDGVIRAREDVFILEEAVVSAEVHARNVVIAGRYSGDVWCETRFEVLSSGRVEGAVRAPELVVHDGAVINGSIQMTNIEPAGSRTASPTSLVTRRASANAEPRS